MNKLIRNKKTQKQIGFYENEFELINSIAISNKNDFSNTVRELVLRGLENTETAENLKDSVNFQIAKLDRNQKEFDKKIMKILMLIFKTSFVSKDFVATFQRKNFANSDEEFKAYLNKIEEIAIKKALKKLGENEE